MARKPYRILIVDDHSIMRDGLKALLSAESEYEVVGTAANGQEAILAATAQKPDIILMDLNMPITGGVDAIIQIKRQHPQVKIIALTFHKEDNYIHAALHAGADAYVLKDDSRTELFTALNSVIQGKRYLSPAISERVIAGYLAGNDANTE